MRKATTTSLLTLICVTHLLLAQSLGPNAEGFRLHIGPATDITVDGVLDEPIWQTAEQATNFQVNSPIDGKTADRQTVVQMAYDDRNLYVAATCYDSSDYVIQSLKRDTWGESDDFAVFLDPFNQRSNGFGFGTSVLGSPSEALMFGSDGDESWDNRWFVATQQYADRWTIEMAIPFKTLRFAPDQREWGVQFVRIEPGSNEVHVWAPVPRQFDATDMGYYGTLIFQEAPAKVGNNVSIIPYLSTRTTDDFNPETKQDWALDAGGDIKIGITPSLNLDLTYRPDFSQVEVDAQVTNLTRFNIFFPERRQFFIENNDIFSAFGQFADNPFYSRRIGLDANGRTVPIQYGARLTGNISERTRIGLLNMQTQSKPDRPGENYSAAVFQRRFWQRSSFSGIFLNRQSFDGGRAVEGNYGRNLGGEIAMSTPDSKWEGELGYLQSFKDGISGDNQHVYSHFAYSGQRFRTFLDLQHLGSNYYADMGFTGRLVNYDPDTDSFVRLGYTQVSNMIDFYTYPAHHPRVNFHWSGLENFVWINDETGLNEWYTRLRHFIFFQNTSELRFRLNNNFVDLIFPFGLTDTPLPVGDYNMTEFNVEFRTDQRRRLNTGWSVVYGQFFNGNKLTYEGNIRFRVQPWGNFTVGIEQNDIWLPEPYGNLHLTLASLRAEINFSTRLFWTTFLQYNTQADNFNINSRLQWRFAPMSDVFLVYTDNYRVAGIFGPKERTVALKVNYWLTL